MVHGHRMYTLTPKGGIVAQYILIIDGMVEVDDADRLQAVLEWTFIIITYRFPTSSCMIPSNPSDSSTIVND